jgi:hypothetical protein
MDYKIILKHQPDNKTIEFSEENLAEFTREIVGIVLAEIGFKPHPFQSGKIFRTEMIKVIGKRGYDKAVSNGYLIVHKDGENTSKVYAKRMDWERYLKLHINKQI